MRLLLTIAQEEASPGPVLQQGVVASHCQSHCLELQRGDATCRRGQAAESSGTCGQMPHVRRNGFLRSGTCLAA